jgi:RsiW-degrading membrane proteinase PrsW (M82 family)
MIFIVLLTALLPVGILIFYINYKDRLCPEPSRELVKAFLIGMLSVPLSFCISVPLELLGFYSQTPTGILGSVALSFFGAAIPEELAKLFILWLILRNNWCFDEKMDGIVYAVCVSLGFAAVENVLYLFTNFDNFVSVGLGRALFAVPGHFCFGVIMGYYYSLAKFYPDGPKKNKSLVIIAPIVVHGIYDSILFVSNVTPALSGILTIVFLYFCHKMWKYGSKKIQEHLERDCIY